MLSLLGLVEYKVPSQVMRKRVARKEKLDLVFSPVESRPLINAWLTISMALI
jgi:hypothetical protein